jgi:hypothetical protein
MLQIGSPKAKLIKEKIDDKEIDGVHFKVEKMDRLTMVVNHNAKDDTAAKKVLKAFIPTIPGMGMAYNNIQLIDDKGRIL